MSSQGAALNNNIPYNKYGHCFVLAGKLIMISSIFALEEYIIYQSGIVLAVKNKYAIFSPWIFKNKIDLFHSQLVLSHSVVYYIIAGDEMWHGGYILTAQPPPNNRL